MLLEEYRKAKKLGNAQYRRALSRGETPHPQALDEILKEKKTVGEVELGVTEIPMQLIVGTKGVGRQGALSPEFLPLFDEDSEFAGKWMRLYDSQMEEGIREPIIAYEYKNRFYVQEGSKRVSIMKYLKMPSILASVIRILPEKEDTAEGRKYEEFLAFYQQTRLNEILFSEPGSYTKLLQAMGKDWDSQWSEEEIRRLKNVFYHFCVMYSSMSGEQSPEVIGDAFLRCLTIFPYEELKEKTSYEIGKEIKKIKEEIEPQALSAGVEHIMEPQASEASFVTKLLPIAKKKLKVAFIYDGLIQESGWTGAHELGRMQVETRFKDEFTTTAFENIQSGDQAEDIIERAIAEGNTVIFTTTPVQIQSTIKAALKHPDVYFFNCSLNYPYKSVRTYEVRSYEVKFLLGLIAGIMSEDDTIGYEADYPIYGNVANINAFAIGVQMVKPQAKVRLHWRCVKEEYQSGQKGEGIILAKETTMPEGAERLYGLYQQLDGTNVRLAAGVTDWGKFYCRILELIADGTWKKQTGKSKRSLNYWWGFSAGVVELVCSKQLPCGTKKLVDKFRRFLSWGVYHPFEGVIYDQEGRAHGSEDVVLDLEEIITMNWLCENVVGRIPVKEELTEKAQELVALQGVLEETV